MGVFILALASLHIDLSLIDHEKITNSCYGTTENSTTQSIGYKIDSSLIPGNQSVYRNAKQLLAKLEKCYNNGWLAIFGCCLVEKFSFDDSFIMLAASSGVF